MTAPLRPLDPGRTFNIGTRDHLTQIQHKVGYVDIVDHFDKGPNPVNVHLVTRVRPDGTVETRFE